MTKMWKLLGLMLCLVLLACSNIDLKNATPEDIEKIAAAVVICDDSYMRVGFECCLDANNDTICDNDERVKGRMIELSEGDEDPLENLGLPKKTPTDESQEEVPAEDEPQEIPLYPNDALVGQKCGYFKNISGTPCWPRDLDTRLQMTRCFAYDCSKPAVACVEVDAATCEARLNDDANGQPCEVDGKANPHLYTQCWPEDVSPGYGPCGHARYVCLDTTDGGELICETYPWKDEVCNNIDDDCDNEVDEEGICG